MVKASYKDKLPGIVHGSSGSGSTLFVEPHSVHQLNNELRVLEGVEQEEIYQVLAGLSGQVAVKVNEIGSNLEIMAQYDFAFAKARLSRMMNAIEPLVNQGEYIKLIGARHPLLNDPVPLNFIIGKDYRSLIITGPNTGGKTVAMKTIGLLTIMMQTGLHVPVANGSEMAVFTDVLADIGDGQDIKQSLSTFSAHITNIIGILGECGPGTLVLLDEVGTGTDPVEGSVLAMAILEYLYEKRSITIASTHYPELKQYAIDTPGFKNGCMAFDRVNLRPLYSLIIGQSGESNALWIAEKLGLPGYVLVKAKKRLKANPSVELELQPVLEEPQSLPKAEIKDSEIIPEKEKIPTEAIQPKNDKILEKIIKIGDLVAIPFLQEKGVVCTEPDTKGRIRVLVKGKKMDIPVKRVNVLVAAEQLYPEDYDLDVVFLSKEDRKLKKKMNKGHVPGLTRIIALEEQARK
jgi:dsDNA-specific endonuclease/ATPase MutS2